MQISVIIPTYNRGQVVARAIESVLSQTRKPDEVIVVDDGSTDGTRDRLSPLSDSIRYIFQENRGASAARNAGIRAAKGDWLGFLDSDDYWEPDKLERQFRLIEKTRCRACFTGHAVSDGRGMLSDATVAALHPDLAADRMEGEEIRFEDPVAFVGLRVHPLLPTMVAERRLVEEAGMFDESLFVAEDSRLIFNLALLSPVGYINAPLLVVFRNGRCPGLSCDSRASVAVKKMDSYLRTHSEIYWRLLETGRPELRVLRGQIASLIARRAELACAFGPVNHARTVALEGLGFAGSWRVIARCLAVLLLPQLVGWRCRKKYLPL